MDENEQVGPRAFQAYGYQSCMGCRYHDQRMIKSGLHPLYWHYCLHPSNPKMLMEGNMFGEKGRLIGSNHVTPMWCEALKSSMSGSASGDEGSEDSNDV